MRVGGLTVAGLCALCVLLPLVGGYVLERVFVPKIAARLGVEIKISSLSLRPSRVVLRGLLLRVPGRPDPMICPRAEVKLRPLSLLHGVVEVTEVILDKPLLQLYRGGDEDNLTPILERLKRSPAGASESGGKRRIAGPDRLTVQSAQVVVQDELGSAQIAGMDASVVRFGESHVTLHQVLGELAAGTTGKAEQVTLRWSSAGHFAPTGMPEIGITGGQFAPTRQLAMTGIHGSVRRDESDIRRAIIALAGSYGGASRDLWQATGWIQPGDGAAGEKRVVFSPGTAKAELVIRAERFKLSSLEHLLDDTPIQDADKTEVDASLELKLAERRLLFAGSFHMANLSIFSQRLVSEPLHGLSFDISAHGQVDFKSRRIRLEKASVLWNGVRAELDGDAEAQPAHQTSPAPAESAGAKAAKPGSGSGRPGWRERWRTVALHLVVPPIGCQALLEAIPRPIVPHIADFKLGGNFSTDVTVRVDFAKLLNLPAPHDPNAPEEEETLDTGPALVKGRGKQNGKGLPAAIAQKDPKDDPVQLFGTVGIDGCQVLEATKEMRAPRLLGSFTHAIPVEGDREMRYTIGPESPDFVPFDEISPLLIHSIMSTEDFNFVRHRGFITSEFRSALQANLERGYFRVGASSISMQMVKNVLLSREKTLSRKLQELFLTWYLEGNLTSDVVLLKHLQKGGSAQVHWLTMLQKEREAMALQEASLAEALPAAAPPLAQAGQDPAGAHAARPGTVPDGQVPPAEAVAPAPPAFEQLNPVKKRILEIYFNAIEFGPYLYGIGRASRHYFGKSPKDLTAREAAWFSSILPNPKRRYVHFCKGAPDEGWEKYIDRILRRTYLRGRLAEAPFNQAMAERLVFNREEALPERDCLALILRMTEQTPAAMAAQQPLKLPPPPPWATGLVHTVSKHP